MLFLKQQAGRGQCASMTDRQKVPLNGRRGVVKQRRADVQLVCDIGTSATCMFSLISVFGKSAVLTAVLTLQAPYPIMQRWSVSL